MGIKLNTVYSWAKRENWHCYKSQKDRKAERTKTKALVTPRIATIQSASLCRKSPIQALEDANKKFGKQARRNMSKFVTKQSKALAKTMLPVRDMQDAANLERMRASLWPDPIRTESLNVNLNGSLSPEAINRIEQMARIM